MTNRKEIPVLAPPETLLHGRIPLWKKAHKDPGGPGSFDDFPYLHLPYGGGDFHKDQAVTRVFSPRRKGFVCIDCVMKNYGGWYFVYERKTEAK